MSDNTIIVSVDSRYRDMNAYKNSGKFNFYLPNTLRNIISIRLSSIELPNLFYTFTKAKHNISFIITTLTIAPYIIEITEGNYISGQMLSELNKKFAELNTLTGLLITASFNSINGKITLSSTNNFDIDFTDYNNEPNPSLGKYLGFIKNKYEGSSSYTGEGILDVIGDPYVYLRINDYGDLITQFNDKNILAKIVIRELKNIMIFDDGSNFVTKQFVFKNPQTINRLNVELIDQYGRTLDMVNMNFSFTLEFKMIYDNTKSNAIYYDDVKNKFDINFKQKY
jgi:hypothetical protein